MNLEKLKETIIIYQWEDSSMGFICPKCGNELIGDSQNGEEECDCGLKYQFCNYLLINGMKVAKYEQEHKCQ